MAYLKPEPFVSKITYSMLRVINRFENDRAEVTVEITSADQVEEAIALAKQTCEDALKLKKQYRGSSL